MLFETLKDYFTNLLSALLGKTKNTENTENAENTENTIIKEHFANPTSASRSISAIILVVLFGLVFSFLYGYGAAKLSYCYNVSVGNASSALVWSVLAFFFSGFYYPYYALILNPLCVAKAGGTAVGAVGAVVGGVRRRR